MWEASFFLGLNQFSRTFRFHSCQSHVRGKATPTFYSSQIWNKGTTPVDSCLYVGRLPDCLGDEFSFFFFKWREERRDQITWRSPTHLLLSGCTAGNDHKWTSRAIAHTKQWRDPTLEGTTETPNQNGGFTSHNISCSLTDVWRRFGRLCCIYVRADIRVLDLLSLYSGYLLTYLLTYAMQQNPSWESNRFSASQEIPRIL